MKTNNLKEEFISKFTVWNDKYKYATLQGKEEYPTPDMIADWWIDKLDKQKEEILEIIENSKDVCYRCSFGECDCKTGSIRRDDIINKIKEI